MMEIAENYSDTNRFKRVYWMEIFPKLNYCNHRRWSISKTGAFAIIGSQFVPMSTNGLENQQNLLSDDWYGEAGGKCEIHLDILYTKYELKSIVRWSHC